MSITVFLPNLKVGHFYKVPRGQELPFAGRWLCVEKVWPGCVDFCAAGGNLVRLSRAASERLAEHADGIRDTTPKSFLTSNGRAAAGMPTDEQFLAAIGPCSK